MPRILMPQAGKSSGEVLVRRWLAHVGKRINKGDPVLEVESDEGLAQIESAVDGLLTKITAKVGSAVGVGDELGVIGEGGQADQAAGGAAAEAARTATITAAAKAAFTVAVGEATGTQSKIMSKPTGAVVPVLMPKAGQSMEEGTLLKWHVQPGAAIKQGQVIFEIETDKATMDVEATDSGRLARIVVGEGQVVQVLTPVAYLADNDADVDAAIEGSGVAVQSVGAASAAATPSAPAAAQAAPAPADVSDGGRIKASPAARRIASQRGVDLRAVGAGSGPGGRIVSTDVPTAAARPSPQPSLKPSPGVPGEGAKARPPVAQAGGGGRRPMSKMRKAIAANLSLSKQTIPHFYIKATINAEPLWSFYQSEKAKYPCSVNDVIILAVARVMMEMPQFRSRIDGDQIIEFGSANIGVAVGMDEGLVVPVLVGAQAMSLKQLGVESKRVAASARAGKIEGIGKGLLTISNMGMFGVEEFYAIINPPEAAILAVGAVREDIVVSGGAIKAGRVMTMTLSVDHRIIDGTLAAKFLARMKELLENPQQLAQ